MTTPDTAAVVKTLLALLTAIESSPRGELASSCRAAIRRFGRSMADVAGPEEMRSALRLIEAADPQQADTRRDIILAAWADVPGWRS